MWNRDSPVSDVSLHWWPRRDWSSLWPRLRRASSRTVTRPSCRQYDNPTWSHTAFYQQLSCPGFTLAAGLPSGFTTNGVGCWGEPCGEPAISLHSHHDSLVQWTTCLLPFTRDPGSNPQGVLMWNRNSPVSIVSLHGIQLVKLSHLRI
jgi:hypothetical protein